MAMGGNLLVMNVAGTSQGDGLLAAVREGVLFKEKWGKRQTGKGKGKHERASCVGTAWKEETLFRLFRIGGGVRPPAGRANGLRVHLRHTAKV